MEKELLLLSEYCRNSRVTLDFILRLEEEGLIEIEGHEEQLYIAESQLHNLETFSHLYYDLAVNVEGIDIINNLLTRLRDMEQELTVLRRRLNATSPLFGDTVIDELYVNNQ